MRLEPTHQRHPSGCFCIHKQADKRLTKHYTYRYTYITSKTAKNRQALYIPIMLYAREFFLRKFPEFWRNCPNERVPRSGSVLLGVCICVARVGRLIVAQGRCNALLHPALLCTKWCFRLRLLLTKITLLISDSSIWAFVCCCTYLDLLGRCVLRSVPVDAIGS